MRNEEWRMNWVRHMQMQMYVHTSSLVPTKSRRGYVHMRLCSYPEGMGLAVDNKSEAAFQTT